MNAEETTPVRVVAGRYRLVEALGVGGMGRVWRAHDQQLGVDVAIKEVFRRPGIPATYWEELLLRARREAQHGAKLRNHPNIVTVFDVVIEGGVPWTVMRLVKGITLEELLKEGRLLVDETARIAVAVLGALGAAHEAGIIHRDVKPANIMLADDGGILLTDFGIAVNDVDTRFIQDGGIIGSMAYIAPERADGAQGGPPSDLFSLGVTLYQTTERKSPFQRDGLTATLRAVAVHEPPPPAYAGRLAPLITALMAKDPADRPTVEKALAMAAKPSKKPEQNPGAASPNARDAAKYGIDQSKVKGTAPGADLPPWGAWARGIFLVLMSGFASALLHYQAHTWTANRRVGDLSVFLVSAVIGFAGGYLGFGPIWIGMGKSKEQAQVVGVLVSIWWTVAVLASVYI